MDERRAVSQPTARSDSRSLAIEIREERAGDLAAIREVNELAFGQPVEANIVDALRSNGAMLASLVAIADDRVVGHVMYSPVSLNGIVGAGLGPVAVLPGDQRRGIGSALITAGNAQLQSTGCPFIVVLGHAHFYPRFGFRPARGRGITCEWDVPDEAFMLLVLDAAKMEGVSGVARYREEFAAAS